MNFNLHRFRRIVFPLFGVLIVLAGYFSLKLRFSFDFEQFFPQGDPDLVFFQDFIKNFESDDNFLLVGIESKNTPNGVFDQSFLQRFDSLTQKSIALPYVVDNQSLTKVKLPVKSPFGILPVPAMHVEDTSYYAEDRVKILSDQRFVRNLISEDGKSLVLFLKTKDKITLEESDTLIHALDSASRHCSRARPQRPAAREPSSSTAGCFAPSRPLSNNLVTFPRAWPM